MSNPEEKTGAIQNIKAAFSYLLVNPAKYIVNTGVSLAGAGMGIVKNIIGNSPKSEVKRETVSKTEPENEIESIEDGEQNASSPSTSKEEVEKILEEVEEIANGALKNAEIAENELKDERLANLETETKQIFEKIKQARIKANNALENLKTSSTTNEAGEALVEAKEAVKLADEAVVEIRELIVKARTNVMAQKFENTKVNELGLGKLCEAFGLDELEKFAVDPGVDDTVKIWTVFNDLDEGSAIQRLGALSKEGLGGAKGLKCIFKDGCGGDTGKLIGFEKQFGGKRESLGKFLIEGLGNKPELLGHLLGSGCDGNPEQFEKLVESFSSKQDCEKLNALVTEGGLGDYPELLGKIVRVKCGSVSGTKEKGNTQEKETNGLKGLAVAYSTSAGVHSPEIQLSALRGLLEKGGLGKSPNVFTNLLETGCGGDPKKLKHFTGTYIDEKKLREKDLESLGRLIEKGGFGAKPEILGQMFKTIRENPPVSTPKKPSNQKNKQQTKIKTNVEDGIATRIREFANSYTETTDLNNLDSLVQKSDLGENPEAFGLLVHLGCYGKAEKLKQFAKEFESESDLEKLNDLLTKAGMSGKPGEKSQKTLGKLIRDCFPTKPGDLKRLHKSFGDGKDLGELKNIMDAFNDVPEKEEPQPGKLLQRVLGKGNLDLLDKTDQLRDFGPLKTKFYHGLESQSEKKSNVGGIPESKLPLKDLLKLAASFEKRRESLKIEQPSKLPKSPSKSSPYKDIAKANMEHFCERHTTAFYLFEDGFPSGLAKESVVRERLTSNQSGIQQEGKKLAKNTTFWPNGFTETNITEITNLVLDKLEKGQQIPTIGGWGSMRSDEQIEVEIVTEKNETFTVTVGFKRGTGNSDQKIFLGQLYPKNGPGLVTAGFFDMHAISKALKPN